MTKPEQREFVKDLISSVHDELQRKLPHVPDDWDGHELRQWIVRAAAKVGYRIHPSASKLGREALLPERRRLRTEY